MFFLTSDFILPSQVKPSRNPFFWFCFSPVQIRNSLLLILVAISHKVPEQTKLYIPALGAKVASCATVYEKNSKKSLKTLVKSAAKQLFS